MLQQELLHERKLLLQQELLHGQRLLFQQMLRVLPGHPAQELRKPAEAEKAVSVGTLQFGPVIVPRIIRISYFPVMIINFLIKCLTWLDHLRIGAEAGR